MGDDFPQIQLSFSLDLCTPPTHTTCVRPQHITHTKKEHLHRKATTMTTTLIDQNDGTTSSPEVK